MPHAIIGYPFAFDIRDHADAFEDPDGDTLQFHLQSATAIPGLSVSGTTIQGVATETATHLVDLTVGDGRGGQLRLTLPLTLRLNLAPFVSRQHQPQVFSTSTPLAFDASKGDVVFTDVDGHALTYEVTLRSAPAGFTVMGTLVQGTFAEPGFVRGVVRARDDFGGVAEAEFALASPAPIASRPALPLVSHVYDDDLLPLPYKFRISRGNIIPFPDTTPAGNPTTNAGATLGRVLFYDKRLSVMNTHSCGSCHDQAHGFTVPAKAGVGVFGDVTRRNPMGLTNVRYSWHDLYFGDIRTRTLEKLALQPIEDPVELGNVLALVRPKLAATDFYPPLFEAAFGTPDITDERIARAIAQFLRSILSYQSRFDGAYHGMERDSEPRPELLSDLERRGEQLFTDHECTECHDTVSTMSDPLNNGLDAIPTDLGALSGQFRGGSLRNVVATAPYMHDGRFATLAEVLEHYSSGIRFTPNLHWRLRTGEAPKRFNFSEEDKRALEAFLGTLTDASVLTDPKFSDPFQ